MKRLLGLVTLSCACWIASYPASSQNGRTASSQNVATVSSCPGRPTIPVTFQVDCSNVADPATRKLCQPFAENQACKVFWAYRNITGIRLEESCSTYRYMIYDRDKFPHHEGEGGKSQKCGANYMADYSVLPKTSIGPYDVHEILHGYQRELGALPYQHILFAPSMVEARREIGDDEGYKRALSRLETEMKSNDANLQKGTISADKQCLTAEFYIEASLYLKDPKNLERIYRKLAESRSKDTGDPQARFNRAYDAVSGGSAKQYLLAHCPRF